jgi:hypothetical protein
MKRFARHFTASCAVGGVLLSIGIGVFNSVARSAPQANSSNNLHALGQALMQYAQDYDEKLPPVQNPFHMRIFLGPYVENPSVFVGEGNKPFSFNLRLAGRTLDSVYREGYEKGEGVVAFFERQPRPDGSRWLNRMAKPQGYTGNLPIWADNYQPTVDSVTAAQWQHTKQLFRLPG